MVIAQVVGVGGWWVADTVNHRGWWFTSHVMSKTLNLQELPMCVALGKCVCQMNVMTRTLSLKSLRS